MASDALDPLRPLPAPKPYDPTHIERRMYDALDTLGIRYEMQREFGYYRVDAYLPDYRLVLEADGCVWHCCSSCNGDEPNPDRMPAQEVRRRDEARNGRLGQFFRLRIAHIWGHDLQDDASALMHVRETLVRKGVYLPSLDISESEPEPEPLPLLTHKEAHAAKVHATWERKRERSAERNAEWDAERERRKRAAGDIAQLRKRLERDSEQYLRSLLDEDREDTEQ